MKVSRLAVAAVGFATYAGSFSLAASASTGTSSQYASGAVGSSEYGLSSTNRDYSAARAIGAPDVTACEDNPNAWASLDGDNAVETLTLSFTTPMVANQIKIWMNVDPRALTKVEVQGPSLVKTSVFTRVMADSLTSGSKATGAACSGSTITPHLIKKANNANFSDKAVNKVILTFDESIVGLPTWSAETDAVQLIGPAIGKPVASKSATVAGTAAVNKFLSAADGTWTGGPTFTYNWYACNTAGAAAPSLPTGCAQIPGVTTKTFKLTTAQKGKFIRVRVTATNLGGAVVSFSATSAKVS